MDCSGQLYIKRGQKYTPSSFIALTFCGNIRLWPAVSGLLVPAARQQTPKAPQLDWITTVLMEACQFSRPWLHFLAQILQRHLTACRFIPQDVFPSEPGSALVDVHSPLPVPPSWPTASWRRGSARMPEVWHLALHPNGGLKTTLAGNTAGEVLTSLTLSKVSDKNQIKCFLRNTDSQVWPRRFWFRRP